MKIKSQIFKALPCFATIQQAGWHIFAFLVMMLLTLPSDAQDLINDGSKHTISYSGTYKDLTVPNDPAITKIKFTVRGGDGGTAKVFDNPFGENVSFKSKGGQGAFTSVTFSVGSTGTIPLGSTVRFVVGEKGTNGSSGAVVGSGLDWGSGAGGSAVLYKGPSDNSWTLLAVAGGGGGAYQGMFNYAAVDSRNGQGGRSGTGGGDGNGDLEVGSGGTNGDGGTSPSAVLGGPGGGALTPGNDDYTYAGAAGGD
nr:hypothetical protein [Saprospiraceae bacterium]